MKETTMSSEGEHNSQSPVPKRRAEDKPLSAGETRIEQHYKSIGIGAVASALSILKPQRVEQAAARPLPGFLAREDIAA
jgi:hypothetical protein